MPRFDQARLEHIAEAEGYGYKYANLTMLNDLSEWFNQHKHVYKVLVPAFKGITTLQEQAFLKSHDVDVIRDWKKIVNETLVSNRNKIREDKQYPDAFLERQKKFEEQLVGNFDVIINDFAPSTQLDKLFKTSGLDALLAQVRARNERLMVRSTGKEDTKKLANAGGNESKANVKPEAKDVLYANRDVFVSYFGPKSYKQRLGAGDESIFDPVPFTPVLVQRMIGEKSPDALPKCGVMFTEEAEGGIAKYAERDENNNVIGKLKTTGITIIQCAYGHNEGVVNSIIPVDTYYVDNEKNIFSIIRPKTHRMMPDPEKERSLKLVENNAQVVNIPALSREALQTLKAFSQTLESYYNDAMDVEFVVDEGEKIIYIVQARPIVHKTGLANASYITDEDALEKDMKITGESIGVAGGSLRMITDKDQIIVAKNIGEALAIYQDKARTPDTSRIQSVVVGKMAPATSHEATAFRGEGKPVIYSDQWQKLESWLNVPDGKFIVSPQQGLVAHWLGSEQSVEEMIQRKSATEGWINYPIPLLLSLSKQFARRPTKTFEQIIDELSSLKKVKKMGVLPGGITKEQESNPFENLIKTLKQGSREEAESALAELLVSLKFLLKKAHGAPKGTLDESYRRRMTLLFLYALEIAQHIKPELDASPDDKEAYPKRLFPIRMLESILFQKPKLGEIEDGMISAERIIKGLSEERDIRTTERVADPMTIKLMRFNTLAMTDNLKKSWDTFIKSFMQTVEPSMKNDFVELVLKLGRLGALPVWLHTSFMTTNNQIQGASVVGKTLIEEFSKDGDFILTIDNKLKQIKAFNIAVFDNPKNFEKNWKTFQDDILAYFLTDEFKMNYQSSANLGKLVCVGVLTRFVNDVFDLAIKAVTGSQLYSAEEKFGCLRAMLLKYYELFLSLLSLQVQDLETIELSSLRRTLIQQILSAKWLFENFDKATKDFSVPAFTIGSGTEDANLQRLTKPWSLEDVFTLIHQNLLVILGKLGSDAGTRNIERPPLLAMVEKVIQKISKQLLSVDFTKDLIILTYNIPLRTHSCQVVLTYSKTDQLVNVSMRYFGQARQRWEMIEHFITMIDIEKIWQARDIHRTDDAISFELVVGKLDIDDLLYSMISSCNNLTFNDLGHRLDFVTILKQVKNVINDDKILNLLYQKLIKTVDEDILSTNRDIQIQSAALFNALLEYDPKRLVEVVTNKVKKGFFAKSDSTRSTALSIFEEMVKKELAINESLDLVFDGVKNPDSRIRTNAISLLNQLFMKNKGINEALATAQDYVKEINPQDIRIGGLYLYEALVIGGYGINEALALAQESAKENQPIRIREHALMLFKALFSKKVGFSEAAIAAENGMNSNDAEIQLQALEIFRKLFDSGKTEHVAQAAQKATQSYNSDVQREGLGLLRNLVQSGKAFSIAIEAAERCIQRDNSSEVEEQACALFEDLIRRARTINSQPALDTIKETLEKLFEKKEVNLWIVRKLKELLPKTKSDLVKTLEQKGYKGTPLDIALQARGNHRNNEISRTGTDLLGAILKEEPKEAITKASHMIFDEASDRETREKGLDLFVTFFGIDADNVLPIAAQETFNIIEKFKRSTVEDYDWALDNEHILQFAFKLLYKIVERNYSTIYTKAYEELSYDYGNYLSPYVQEEANGVRELLANKGVVLN